MITQYSRQVPPRSLRTLLVDNYDSYTHNIFHLLAMINGQDPIVVTNDEASADELLSLDIDNIVISPGPGRPENPADFHVCLDLLRRAELPILGVCLGHQGIAVAAGGRTTRAGVVMHGRLSRVRHDGPLFAGIPQGFRAVRYHSLRVAEPLPPGLRATAWADDGTVMGLDALDRPVYGVQFHPESVLTEHGERIITNFRDLSIDWWRRQAPRHRRRPRRRRAPSGRPAPPEGRPTIVWERIDGPLDAEVVFDQLRRRCPSVWLDSATEGVDTGRYSYLAMAEGTLAETVLLDVTSRELVVFDRDGNKTNHPGGSLFDYLDEQLRARACPDPPTPPFAFIGGYVGWIGYEARAEMGARSRHASPTADAAMIFADRVLAFDHRSGSVYACAISPREEEGRRWLADTAATLAGLRGRVATPPAPFATGPVAAVPDRSREQYLADIARCQGLLADGETYEVCLTNHFRVPVTEPGFEVHRRLRRSNPAPYGAFVSLDGTEVSCSSPECFMRIDRDGTVRVKPIKGTMPRGDDAETDQRQRAQLAGSEKERAENLMIVDLLRNDLGRICVTGSVRVPSLMAVESFQTVHQLVSTITGTLRPDRSVGDCLRAVFPGGSMTGAPKIRTMDIIDQIETSARGVFSGTIGYLGVDGAADLNIVIRTVVCRDGTASVGAGGAVTILSDAADEWREATLKANAVLGSVNAYVR